MPNDHMDEPLMENELERERRIFREKEERSPSANPGMAEILAANAAKEAAGTMTPEENDLATSADTPLEDDGIDLDVINQEYPEPDDRDRKDAGLEEPSNFGALEVHGDGLVLPVLSEEVEELQEVNPDISLADNLAGIQSDVESGLLTVEEATEAIKIAMGFFAPKEEESIASVIDECRHNMRAQRRSGYVMAPSPHLSGEKGLHLIRQQRVVCTKCGVVEEQWENKYVQTSSESSMANAQFSWTEDEIERWERDGELWQTLSN